MKQILQKTITFFIVLLCASLMELLGCSGCSQDTAVEHTSPESVETPIVPHIHDGGTPDSHDTTETVPNPADLALGRRVGQKHPSLMSESEMQYAFYEAVILAQYDMVEAQKQVHTIAQKVGNGDPDWTEYLHLLGHSLIEALPDQKILYMTLEDALHFDKLKLKLYGENEAVLESLEQTRLQIQWNEDGAKVYRQVQPIRDILSWMEENATADWKVIKPHYDKMSKERALASMPKDLKTGWLTPTERADIRYEAFFDSLELLPDDSLTLRVFFSGNTLSAQKTLLSERANTQAESPPSNNRTTPSHTWDMIHEVPLPESEVLTEKQSRDINSSLSSASQKSSMPPMLDKASDSLGQAERDLSATQDVLTNGLKRKDNAQKTDIDAYSSDLDSIDEN